MNERRMILYQCETWVSWYHYEAEIRQAKLLLGALGHDGYHDNCDPCKFVRRHADHPPPAPPATPGLGRPEHQGKRR